MTLVNAKNVPLGLTVRGAKVLYVFGVRQVHILMRLAQPAIVFVKHALRGRVVRMGKNILVSKEHLQALVNRVKK
jgi:hypothetical protein